MSDGTAIEVQDLRKNFGDVHALKGINLDIAILFFQKLLKLTFLNIVVLLIINLKLLRVS